MKFLFLVLFTTSALSQTGTNPMGPKTLGQPISPSSGSTDSRAPTAMPGDIGTASKSSATTQGSGTVPNDKNKKNDEEIKLGPYDRDGNYDYRRK